MKAVPVQALVGVVCFVILISMVAAAVTPAGTPSPAAGPLHGLAVTSADWHDGSPQSTALVDVSYAEDYSTIMAGGGNTSWVGLLQQRMWLAYNDGTGVLVDFELHDTFYPGGLDVPNRTVLDWNKLRGIELILGSESQMNGSMLSTLYSFQGFDIVPGNASDVHLSRTLSGGVNVTTIDDVIGSIGYWCDAAKIGAVGLATASVPYGSEAVTESLATFNVTVDAELSNQPLRSAGALAVRVPTVLSFRVTHTTAQTEYKYGVHVDWSAAKAFPTATPLLTGQAFSLVAQDLLMFVYGQGGSEVKAFSTDAGNDTAVYQVDGQVLCRELFTTSYTIDGSADARNTTRVYVRDVYEDNGTTVSAVYVIFDGFAYNESTGFSFDPAVITPNGIPFWSGPGFLVLVGVSGGAVAVVGAVLVWRRRKAHAPAGVSPEAAETTHAGSDATGPRDGR